MSESIESVSEMAPGKSGIAEVMTEDAMLQRMSDNGVDVCEADDWNAAVATNTPESFALPDSINSLEYLEVKGQDIFSSCFAAAGVGTFERQHAQKTNEVKRFAIWPFYMLCQKQTGRRLYGGDNGVVPPDGIAVATKTGFLSEETARRLLPAGIIQKWGGDVYPRNYWKGRGNFNAASSQGYREACAAYEPLLRLDAVREEMHENRFQTIIRNRTTDQVIASERSQTATTLECHVWGSSMDSDPNYLRAFPGPPPRRGAQHGHHATYICGINPQLELLKANSWRPFKALIEARKQGAVELDIREWGDDGVKAWIKQAHQNMMNHRSSWSFACSNITSEAPGPREIDLVASDWI